MARTQRTAPSPLTLLAQERLGDPAFIPALLRAALGRLGSGTDAVRCVPTGGACVTGLPATWAADPAKARQLGDRLRQATGQYASIRVIAEPLGLVYSALLDLVEAARARGGLSGVFARLEIKASPFHAAPWADALVVCHTDRTQPSAHPIPWTRDLPTGGEQDWVFLVELDRATEPLATIGAKAKEYAAMLADPRWQHHWAERFGPGRRPRILWAVPDGRRSAQVQRVWQKAWPDGHWYIATFDELRSAFWQRVRAGERQAVQFFAEPTPPAPGMPVLPVVAVAPAPAAPTPARSAGFLLGLTIQRGGERQAAHSTRVQPGDYQLRSYRLA